jgi:hypothetical protein
MERELYSVVVYPSAAGIHSVAKMKDTLFAKIGWFHSRNAKAHVTIGEFLASTVEAAVILEYIKQFCAQSPKRDVAFYDIYAVHTTCFIAPDELSKAYFREMLRRFKKGFPLHRKLFGVKFSSGAHISIGRLLDQSQLHTSYGLFGHKNAAIQFRAEGLTLRKFDTGTRHFSDVAEFKFKGDGDFVKSANQLSLF